MKKYILLASSMMLLWSCDSKTETAAKDNTETEIVENEAVEVVEESAPDYSNWEEFFADFQTAAVTGDMATVKQMSYGKTVTAEFFEYEYEWVIDGWKEDIKKLSASDAENTKPRNDLDGWGAIDNALLITIHKKGKDESGYDYESSVFYFFSKVDGEYKFLGALMAG